jgi:predicted sulfurtransferase
MESADRIKELEAEVNLLKEHIRLEEIYMKTLRELNNSYWKTIVKQRKQLADLGVHVKGDNE